MDGNLPASPSLGGPNQPPQFIGTPLKRPGLAKLIFGMLLVLFFFTWATFWLDFLGVADVSKYLPFLPSTSLRTSPSRVDQKVTEGNKIDINKTTSFAYDAQKAERVLGQFLKTNLKSEFLPEKIEVKHRLSSSNQQNDTEYTYGAYWKEEDIIFNGFFHFNASSSAQMDTQVLITLPESFPGLNVSAATLLLAKYFNKNNFNQLKCDIIEKITVCEEFLIETGFKKGWGIAGQVGEALGASLIFACEIPEESTHYEWKSCLQAKSDTGIGGEKL